MPDNRYNVGGLEIDIGGSTSSAESAFNEIQTLTRRINSLRKALLAFESINTGGALSKLQNVFSGLSTLTAKLDIQTVQTLTSVSKAMSSLSRIGSLEKVDFDKIGNGFVSLTQKITPFIDKVKEAENSLTALSSILKGSKGAKNALNLTDSTSGGVFQLKNLFSIGKLAIAFRWVKRIGSAVSQIAQSGSDYLETLNLWAVAMRNNLDLGEKFVDKISKAYGISEKTVMNAQATFKNMVGSLGQISEETAYTISEAVTQMAIDYSSLYNVDIQSAFTKFQAALAGQVRPIRSVSGYDITETTLYQLYQSIGGEKTMRQLNRTEKQLLSLLAIYKQMGASGATGDMAKTINQFANQSRIMTEQWDRIKTYSGILVRNFIDSNKILIYLNAGLITLSTMLKIIAGETSDIKGEQFLENIFGNTEESAENANEAVNQLKKNLLGFDKIRALSSADESPLAIDEALLKELEQYQSVLDDVNNEAQELAGKWLVNLKILDEQGNVLDKNKNGVSDIVDKFNELVDTLKMLLSFVIAFAGINIASKLLATASAIKGVATASKILSSIFTLSLAAGLGTIIYSVTKLITEWDKLSESEKTMYYLLIAGGVALTVLSFAFRNVNKEQIKKTAATIADTIAQKKNAKATAKSSEANLSASFSANSLAVANGKAAVATEALGVELTKTQRFAIGFTIAAIGIVSAVTAGITLFETWGESSAFEKIAYGLGLVGGAVLAVVGALIAFKAISLNAVTGTIIALAAIAAITGGILAAKKQASKGIAAPYANGGVLPDKGTLFVAGEAGAEIVYNTGNGGNGGVANIQQIAQATYQGTMAALNDWWGGRNAKGDIPQLTEANATGMYQAVTGVARSYGKKWSNA